jgi:acyl carrier protein
MKDEIRDTIIRDLLDGRTVGNSEDLLISGLVDSLGVMRLIAWIEKRFDLRVPPEDVTIDNFESIDAIDAYLGRRRAA